MKSVIHLLSCSLLLSGLPALGVEEPVTVVSLAQRMFDLQRLPRLEDERAAMESSVDITGDNQDWATWVENGSNAYVTIADLTGPGWVSRLFFGGTVDGARGLRVYLDGAEKPVVDTTFDAFFSAHAPWTRRDNQAVVSLLPMPFAKSLRVQVKAGAAGGRFFYQINHTRLPTGAAVVSFQQPFADHEQKGLEQAAKGFHPSDAAPAGAPAVDRLIQLPAGGSVDLDALSGPGRVLEVRVQPVGPSFTNAAARARFGRDVLFSARWDGAHKPSIETPVGDFFGQPWRAVRYASLAFGSDGTEWFNRLPMPFAKSAAFAFANEGGVPHALRVRVWTRPAEPRADVDGGYLHAGFQRSEPDDSGPEHPVLRIRGDGKFVGSVLTVVNKQDQWSGFEGDDSVRVDEEQIPGWRGTSVEHAFNAPLSYSECGAFPHHGVLARVPFKSAQYRLHVLDAPRFRRSIDVQVERGGQNLSPLWVESLSFCYLREPQDADTLIHAPESRRPPRGNWDAATIMTDLAGLEAMGDTSAAIRRIEEFNAENPDPAVNPYLPLLKLRRETLLGHLNGFATVTSAIAALRTSVTNADFTHYADEWAWLHASPTNTLVAVYANPPVEVFVNGVSIGRSGTRDNVRLLRAPVGDGPQVLALESTARSESAPWLQAMVWRGGKQILSSDAAWRAAHDPAGEWKKSGYDDVAWTDSTFPVAPRRGPLLPALSVVPHPVPGLHSHTLNIVRETPADRKVTAYRRTFTVPATP